MVASFAAPMFGYVFPALIPGFVLLFIGRMVRRTQRRGPLPEAEAPPPPPRPLGTQRESAPVTVEVTGPTRTLEDVLLEGVERDPDPLPEIHQMPDIVFDSETLSSDEMIARARSRWDKRP